METINKKIPLLLAFAYLIFLVVFAVYIHPIEDNGRANPELDFYVKEVRSIATGNLPKDVYRPALYPFLGAILGKAMDGNYFLGSQVISIISGFIFVLSCFFIAREAFGELTAWVSTLFIAFNINILSASVRAASDMLFNALIMMLLYWCIVTDKKQQKHICDFMAMGVLFGLAYITRYTAVFIVPVLVIFFLSRWKDYSLRHYAVFAMAAIIIVTPQLIINQIQFGSLFYNENWRNIAVHYFGTQGLSWNEGFYHYSQSDVWAAFMNDPFFFIKVGAVTIFKFVASGLAKAVFGNTFGVFPIMLRALTTSVLLLAVLFAVLKGSLSKRMDLLLFSYVIITVMAIGFTYSFQPRFILPVIFIIALYFASCLRFFTTSNHRWRLPVLIAVSLALLGGNYFDAVAFAGNHTPDDLRAAQWLAENKGDVTVMGTSLFLGNHIDLPYIYLDSLTVIEEPEAYIDVVKSTVRENTPDYFIVNQISSYGNETPQYLLTAPNDTFLFLVPIQHFGSSIIFQIDYGKFSK